MRIGLLLATLGRSTEVERLLLTLDAQTYRDFELIVIDQNRDDRLVPILQNYKERLSIVHLRRSMPGLSRNRNEGVKALSSDAEILAFPDDDCWYPSNLLADLASYFTSHKEVDGISGICMTKFGTPRGRWASKPGFIDKSKIFGRCISFTMFLRKTLVDKIGPFDETLGLAPDVPWPGGEDFDYLFRAVTTRPAGRVFYSPQFRVFHDDLPTTLSDKAITRRYNDGKGFGRFLKKHQYSKAFLFYYTSRYLGGAAICATLGNIPKAKYRWSALAGTYRGFFDDPEIGIRYLATRPG